MKQTKRSEYTPDIPNTTQITSTMSVFTSSIINVASDGLFQGCIALTTQGDWEFIYEAGGNFNVICADDFDWAEAQELVELALPEIKKINESLHVSALYALSNLIEYLESRLDDLENSNADQD